MKETPEERELRLRASFLADIEFICRKHGFSISHEDSQGAFQVVPFDEYHMDWLLQADYGRYKLP